MQRSIIAGTEAIIRSQAASMPFAKTTQTRSGTGEFLVLGSFREMRFLVPVVPGNRMDIEVKVIKIVGDIASTKGVVHVDEEVTANGNIGFGRRKLKPGP